MSRKLHVTLLEHGEGVSVSCLELPGCHSQGRNINEAMRNIRDAVEEYLEVWGEPVLKFELREKEVTA